MNPQQIKSHHDSITHLVAARRLNAAIDGLGRLLDTIYAPWDMRQELEALRHDYRQMARYALDGVDDPRRREVYDDVAARLLTLLARAERQTRLSDDSTLYYSTLRYEMAQKSDSISSLAEALTERALDIATARLAGNRRDDINRLTAAYEATEKRLFNRVWTTFPLSASDTEALTRLLTDDGDDLVASTRLLLVSALLLAMLANYDERALSLLASVYTSTADTRLRVRALTALLIAMSMHHGRRRGRRFADTLAAAADSPTWQSDVRAVFLQFIRTRDTEKITRTVRDELIPEMLRLRPDIYRKIAREGNDDAATAGPDENPEWEELLEKSGVADKMRRLQEMQEEGADVMMSTFGALKSFPFFNDVANWMLPYRPAHSSLAEAGGNVSGLTALIAVGSNLCDSDRYSVALAMGRMPQGQLDMLMQQLEGARQQMEDMEAASADDVRDAEIRSYVQDLYRFFKLFRRKGEFADPFETPLNLVTLPGTASVFEDPDALRMFAEFYFKRGYYEDAYALLGMLEQRGEASAATWQKMGYCLQRTGDRQGALDCYSKAEMLSRDDRWTLGRIAAVNRMLGRPAEALAYYERLGAIDPDDLGIALHTGHCLMELGRYDQALRHYFKVEYLDPDSHRAERPIAWCSFLAGDYERSRDYYGRIPADALTWSDLLNMGHLEMASGNYRAALDRYRHALDGAGGDRKKFASSMQADLHYLRAAGVDDLLTGIVLDALLADV